MKKSLPLLLFLVFLAVSCRSYTIQDGRNAIVYPEPSTLETRYSKILEEEERIAAEERRIEWEKAEAARLAAEATRINEYPENLKEMVYPFLYNPVKSKVNKADTPVVTLRTIFIPLGEERLSGNEIAGILSSISDMKADVIGFTGSLENQTSFAKSLGLDAVTVEGGTIAYRDLLLDTMTTEELALKITDTKTVSFLVEDFKPVLPSGGILQDVLKEVEELENAYVESFVEGVSRSGNAQRILFLSSFAPSSSDWTDWTEFEYRDEESFMISDILTSLKWQDAYQETHYSVETAPGTTRTNGEIRERLDFIYTKGVMAVASFTLPLEKTESIAVVADFILP